MKIKFDHERLFWEWCGWHQEVISPRFRRNRSIISSGGVYWFYLEEKRRYNDLPPIDLNNLFRYAVPKFKEVYGEDKLYELLHDWIDECVGDYKKDVLALFWLLSDRALWQVKEQSK